MEFIDQSLASGNYGMIWLVIAVILVFWFLPAFLAFFLNRKHFKLILLACIPAGLSFVAWGGVIVWATTGKVVEKYANRVDQGPET